MKELRFIMLALVITMATLAASAQKTEDKQQKREQMIEVQARNIANELALDDNTCAKFIATYTKYKQELWNTAPKHDKRLKNAAETEEQAQQNMQRRFERSQKILDIRTKYYKEFSKFMTQKQIEQMYAKEKKIMQRLKKRHEQKPRR